MTTVLVAVLIAAALYGVWVFNRLISLKVRAKNAWSDIDVQLRRRADLVPSLVQTVRGYAAHERTTLERAVQARSDATQAQSHAPSERGRVESEVGRRITQLLAIAEAYPDLKANEMFASLHKSLVEIEDHIQSARRYYNAVVRDLNTMIRQFPPSLVAGLFRIKPLEFFELDSAAQAAAPAVDLAESQP